MLGRANRIALEVRGDVWPMRRPFSIAGRTFTEVAGVVVTLRAEGRTGRGEATGAFYKSESPQQMIAAIEAARADIEAAPDRQTLRKLMPAGGARNAVDCAMWELEAKLTGRSVWAMADVSAPRPLLTTYTLGVDTPEAMAAMAVHYADARALKLKLNGESCDAARVEAVRDARPDTWLGVDANQSLDLARLKTLLPRFVDLGVKLVEQPLPMGREAELEGFESPIPIAADESVQGLDDVAGLVGRFQAMNIKLDKSGGLTEGLMMAERARNLGLQVMVGNMTGTVLSTAPGCVVGQHCDVVDLDGPIMLARDREPAAIYEHGEVRCPDGAWGLHSEDTVAMATT